MTLEDKRLLLKDLCARLPYGVILDYSFIEDKQRIHTKIPLTYRNIGTVALDEWHTNEEIFKPYLRPMSSMTDDERKEYNSFIGGIEPFNSDFSAYSKENKFVYEFDIKNYIDWLNAHNFDYRGLIEKGLALEAPKGMYNIK